MKKSIFWFVLGLTSFTISAQKFERMEQFKVRPLEIECTITPEDSNFYSISWSVPLIDSTANATGQLPTTELHCFVNDSTGLIGYYRGLSTPVQHCFFQTKDSVVKVFFRWRRIPHTYHNQDSVEVIVSAVEISPFNKTSFRGYEFESILLPVHSTINRKITLLNDTNTVRISYGTDSKLDQYDPLGHPYGHTNFSYSGVITLDRYYLSLRTGRIATGQKWINRKGIRKVVQKGDQYVLVSPSMKYMDKNYNPYSGAELIKTRGINLKKFDLPQFRKTDKENIPY